MTLASLSAVWQKFPPPFRRRVATTIAALTSAWRMVPLKTTLAIVIVCFAVRENFPFSHFPMYASFSDYSYYIYIADGEGEPVPILDLSGHRTSALKKYYDEELEDERERLEDMGVEINGYQFMTAEQRRGAGLRTLQWIYDNAKDDRRPALNERRPLRLYHVHLRFRDGKVKEETELIAELP